VARVRNLKTSKEFTQRSLRNKDHKEKFVLLKYYLRFILIYMKDNILRGIVITLFLSLTVFTACSSGGDNEKPNPSPNPNPSDKTMIIFDNTDGICAVSVYKNSQRNEEDKIVEIPAGGKSEKIEWAPGPFELFYFSYTVALKGISGFTFNYVPEIGKDRNEVRVDANKTTTTKIPILSNTVSSPDKLLSNRSYLSIQNNSSFSFELHRGSGTVLPDNLPDSLVNVGEMAQYTISPGTASIYKLFAVWDYIMFSGFIGDFETGCVYSFIFDGAVSLITKIELKLENVAGIIQNSPGLYRGKTKIGEQNLASSLTWISANAVNGDDFYIVLGENESSPPVSLNYSGRNVGITLLGYGGERKITLNANGSLFTANSGVTLTIDENITLTGRSANTDSLVYLNNGRLFVKAGAKITGNTVSSSSSTSSGGVFVTGTNANFTMNGGEIIGNKAAVSGNGRGGGVFVNSGNFTMNRGEISGNTSSSPLSCGGGGVFVNTVGTFTMNGGVILGKPLPVPAFASAGVCMCSEPLR